MQSEITNDNAPVKHKTNLTKAHKEQKSMLISSEQKQKSTHESKGKYIYNNFEKEKQKKEYILYVQCAICIFFIISALFLKFLGGNVFAQTKAIYENALTQGINFSMQTPILRFIDESVKTMQSFASEIGEMANRNQDAKVQNDKNTIILPQNELTSSANSEMATYNQNAQIEYENSNTEYSSSNLTGMGGKTNTDEAGKVPDSVNLNGYSNAVLLHQPTYGVLTSKFGFRTNPISQKTEFHLGIDIAAQEGAAVMSAADGQVVEVSNNSIRGNYVVIHHFSGLQTLYQHLNYTFVRTGQSVKAGERIATVGNTGYSTGPHLHFELIENGKYVDSLPQFKQLNY